MASGADGAKGGAGYSGTHLSKKLGIESGHTVAVLGAPEGFIDALDRLPDGVSFVDQLRPGIDVIVTFHLERVVMTAEVEALLANVDLDGAIWIAWPKKASRVPTDITEDVVREVFLPHGVVDNKVCAIDATWSGLRLVWRKEERAARRQP